MSPTLGLQGEARDEAIAVNFAHWLGRHSQRKAKLATNAKELVYETSLVSDLHDSPAFARDALCLTGADVGAVWTEQRYP